MIDTKAITEELNRLITNDPELSRVFAPSPGSWYYSKTWGRGKNLKEDKYRYGWTKARAKEGDKVGYIAFVRKRVAQDKTSETWKVVRKVVFGRKKIARARATKWYNQRIEVLRKRGLVA